jgi:hypothetical protein
MHDDLKRIALSRVTGVIGPDEHVLAAIGISKRWNVKVLEGCTFHGDRGVL